MKKVNPLFVDSTKFQGDPTSTQIELKNVMLYDGEELCVMIAGQTGRTVRAPMTLNNDFVYEAHVHLSYQQSYTIQFIVEKDGVLVLHSSRILIRAQYVHSHEWDPIAVGESEPMQINTPTTTQSSQDYRDANWARETSRGIKSIIEKWGL